MATASQVADLKSNLSDAAAVGHGEVLAVLEHSVGHLIGAAKHLHPNIPAIEAELKPAITELTQYAFSLMPGLSWVKFLEPQVEALVNHQLDVGLKQMFPEAAAG